MATPTSPALRRREIVAYAPAAPPARAMIKSRRLGDVRPMISLPSVISAWILPISEAEGQNERHAARLGDKGLAEKRLIPVHQGQGHAGDRPQQQGDDHGPDDDRRAVFQQAVAGDNGRQRVHDQVRDAQGGTLVDVLPNGLLPRLLLLLFWQSPETRLLRAGTSHFGFPGVRAPTLRSSGFMVIPCTTTEKATTAKAAVVIA